MGASSTGRTVSLSLKIFAAFAVYLKTEKKREERTIGSYCSDLRTFAAWLAERLNLRPVGDDEVAYEKLISGQAAPDSLTHGIVTVSDEVFTAFLAMQQTQMTASTAHRRLAGLNAFYAWLTAQGWRTACPQCGLKLVPKQSPAIQLVTDEHLQRLLAAIPDRHFMDLRDKASLMVMSDTGMRTGELIALNVEHLSGNSLKCVRRGRKDRDFTLDKQTVAVLSSYLKARGGNPQPTEPLFVNKNATRLTARSLRRKIEAQIERAGLKCSITPKMLMHRRRLLKLQSGCSPDEVRQAAGVRHFPGSYETALRELGKSQAPTVVLKRVSVPVITPKLVPNVPASIVTTGSQSPYGRAKPLLRSSGA